MTTTAIADERIVRTSPVGRVMKRPEIGALLQPP